LSTQILKNNINPSRYIRFVNNRITLENAEIRAASISTLGKFGIRFDEVRNQVKSIMKQSFEDADDEVRERALFYYTNLDSANVNST
jgi:coatomer protein complex subunit gamma